MVDETLVRVVAPHFVAGAVFVVGRCTEAAPILRWLTGKTNAEARAYFARKGWKASIVRKPRRLSDGIGDKNATRNTPTLPRLWGYRNRQLRASNLPMGSLGRWDARNN